WAHRPGDALAPQSPRLTEKHRACPVEVGWFTRQAGYAAAPLQGGGGGRRIMQAIDRGGLVAITVLGGEPASRALAAAAVARAGRAMPKLGRGGRDVIVVTADSRGYDPPSSLPGSGLIVMTGRPSVVQAAAALLMGADAYLPVDLQPSRAADALDRVMRGQTHIEPETAEALRTLVILAGGLQ